MPSNITTIYIASDPWAAGLHRHLADALRAWGYAVEELSPTEGADVPYYESARRVAVAVSGRRDARGIVICGTGMGVAMTANSFPGIACALCEHTLTAHRARAFNNANVLALGAYFTTPFVALEILSVFLETPFGDGVDPTRAEEILRWYGAVRAMETRMAHPDWAARSVPAHVAPVVTEADV